LRTSDPFDDQHGAGADGATQQVGCFRAIRARNGAKQLAAACEEGLSASVSGETEVANADQSFGQNVEKESSMACMQT